jgi:hypothetical protein
MSVYVPLPLMTWISRFFLTAALSFAFRYTTNPHNLTHAHTQISSRHIARANV